MGGFLLRQFPISPWASFGCRFCNRIRKNAFFFHFSVFCSHLTLNISFGDGGRKGKDNFLFDSVMVWALAVFARTCLLFDILLLKNASTYSRNHCQPQVMIILQTISLLTRFSNGIPISTPSFNLAFFLANFEKIRKENNQVRARILFPFCIR